MAVNHKVVRQFFDQVKDILGIDLIELVLHRSELMFFAVGMAGAAGSGVCGDAQAALLHLPAQ